MMTDQGSRITQGQFSFLPDLTDAQITAQVKYALNKIWAIGIEYTEAARYADTVGWAAGVIDQDGRITEAFEKLRETALARFEQTRDRNIASLHAAMANLVLAIRTHDEDIDPSPDNDDLRHDE